jgi:hypothetical protein
LANRARMAPAQRSVRQRSSARCFRCPSAIDRSAINNRPAIVPDQNHVSICRLEGGAPSACAASLYIALMSSQRNRRVNAAVPWGDTVGSSPARKRATHAGHSSGSCPLKPTVVRPYRVQARCQAGRNAAISWVSAACQSAVLAGLRMADKSGARHAGVSDQFGGSSGKSSRITGPSRRSIRPSACSNTRRWKAALPGSPNGRPSWNGVHSPRGGRVFSICGRTSPIATVGVPRNSSMCANALTARVQMGQTGLSSTASTRSWRNCPLI